MSKNKLLITIDGASATGKGTVAKILAQRLNLAYLDSGLIYRELAFQSIRQGVSEKNDLINLAAHLDLSKINDHINELKTEEIGSQASKIAVIPEVREELLDLQRNYYKTSANGLVTDGRDMGSVVFKNADFKFFVIANVNIRAERRFKELQSLNKNVIYNQVVQDLIDRDNRDSNRDCSPLAAPEGSIIIDTSDKTAEEVADIAIKHIKL